MPAAQGRFPLTMLEVGINVGRQEPVLLWSNLFPQQPRDFVHVIVNLAGEADQVEAEMEPGFDGGALE